MRHRGFTFVRLSDPYLLGVRPRRFDPNAHHRRLLTAAAWGGLEPAPVNRLRGACPHLLCSFDADHRVMLASYLRGCGTRWNSYPLSFDSPEGLAAGFDASERRDDTPLRS